MANDLQTCYDTILSVQDTFSRVLIDNSVSFEREAAFAMQTLTTSDFVRGVALSNPQSLRDAITNVAAIGISLNPARKQAYLVPRKGVICLDISVFGLCDLAMATGAIAWIQVECVHEKDTFEIRGMDQMPVHNRNPFAKDRGPIVGTYCVVKLATGDYLTHTMDIDTINSISQRSEAFQKGKGPWKTDFVEMARKAVCKQAAKYWPRIERLENAVHYLNTDGGEGIDFEAERSGRTGTADAGRLADLLAQVEKATTPDAVTALWTANVKAVQEEAHNTKDRSTYDAFKSAVQARGKALKEADVTDVQVKAPPADAISALDALVRKIAATTTAEQLLALEPEIDAMPQHLGLLNEKYNQQSAKFGQGQEPAP